MPSIDLYLDTPDLPLLEGFLNDEEDIVFVLASGDGTFTTVGSTKLQPNSAYTLWHVPSGEIPTDCRDNQGRIVVDPLRGVHLGAIGLRLEVCPGKYQQYVPRAELGKVDLKLFTDPTAIGRSGFTWWGNRFKPIGKAAHPTTERWWRRLQRWVSKHAHKVTWTGPLEEANADLRMWAFPFAYTALKTGRPRSLNPVLCGDGKKESNE
jgi:hypothetical protein